MRHFALALALIASPAHSAAPSRDLVKAFAALQRDDARVNEIGYRLATGNAQYCRDARPTVGLLLLDAGAYNVPANIRAVLGISGDFAIQAVAKGSPAQSAGLAAGDELLELEGNRPDVLVRGVSPAEQVRLGFLHDEIEARLAESGSVGLRFGSRPVILKGIAACHAHFELATSGKGAEAGARVVLISRALLTETRSDDEAAFVLGHELAHLALDHQARRKAARKSRAVTLETEREADRLAVWLMANAGYDPSIAPAFLRRRGAKGLAALFPEPNHDRAETRARLVESELAAWRQAQPEGSGQRDWRTRFSLPQP